MSRWTSNALKILSPEKGIRILDLGCGNAEFHKELFKLGYKDII